MSDDQAFRDFLLADKSASRNADPALVPGRVNARVGVTAQPDAQAQFGDLAKRYGVPAAVVENDPEVWKQRAAADEAQQHIDASPKLGQWLGEDPQRAKVSHDSLEAMAGVDHAFSAVFPKNGSDADKLRYWQAVGQRAPLQIKAAPSAASVAISKVRNFGLTLTAGIDSTFAGIDALAAAGFKSVGLDRAAAASKNDAKLGMTRARSNSRAGWGGTLEGGFYQAVESLPVSLGALALGATTGPQSGLAFVGAVSGGQSYLKAQEAGLGHLQSVGFGAIDAAVEVGTEAIPLTRFLQNTAVGTSIGKRLLENVVEENVGEQVATALQDLNQWAQIDSNKGKTFADYLAERPDAALQTAIATTLSAGIINTSVVAGEFAARRAARKQQQAANAQRAEVLLTGLKELAEAAPVAQRDVSTFENWVRSAAEGTEATDVYIDAQTLVQTLQQSGLTEPEIIAALPSLQTELPTALISNGDVRIPIEEFAARSGELGASLIPHLRLDPNDMSTSEAQTFMQSAQEEFQKETDKAFDEINADNAFRQSAESVKESIAQQLDAAGRFNTETNRAYASLYSSFFARLAADLGETPEAVAARYPVQIQAEGVTDGAGVLDQRAPTHSLPKETQEDIAHYVAELSGEAADFVQTTLHEGGGLVDPLTLPVAVLGTDEINVERRSVSETAAGGFPLFQRKGSPRGQASFASDITSTPSIITLLRGADLSTFLHESGHFFFEVMLHVAAQPDAPQRVVDDMNAFLKWTGVESMGQWSKMSTSEKREHHERFARGFEAYLYEGKAPSLEIKSLFQRFRSWLLTVYRSLKELNVDLTPEVRSIFDRMLASDAQIREAEQQVGYEPILTEKPEGMDDADWEAYQRLGQEATTEAVTDLERRSLRDMRYAGKAAGRELKRLQREIRDMREAMRTEVEADLALEPVYRAQEFMKKGLLNGEAVEGPTKMLLSEVEALYEDRPVLYVNEVKRALGFGQYGMLAKEGIHPEQVAELFGFTSADHMIQDLMLAEPFKKAVETEIDTRMLERYGDITSEKALQDAVDAAIHNDVRGRFVATEFAALSKAPGKPRVLAAAAKQLAEGAVARLKIRNLRPAQYEAAERRAAKAAAEAARKGEVASAAAEKRNQLINFYGAKASRDALTEIDRIVRYFKKFDAAGTRKNLDIGYLDQIDKLLERFDLRKSVTNRQADKRKSLLAWVERQKEQGLDPLIDEELLDEANRTPYRELTVEEMRGLRDAVKNIEHLARLKKKLLTAKDKREFADAVNDVASTIRENAYKRVEEIIGSKSWWEQVKAGVADFLAMHRKMANWAYVMDGNKTGGAVWERFIRPMNERGNFEAARRAQATKDLGALFDRLKGQNLNKRTFVPAIGKSLSLQDRLMVALNLGNEGNTQRVMDGERWEQDQLNAVLEPLTAEHWTFVQAVWDYLDSFYPEVAAKEIRVSGVAPQKVEARPFERQLADGTTVSLRGGYFPIKYDTARSSRAEADTAAEVLQQMTQGKYTSAQTRRGHTKARAEQVDRPVRKDFGVIFEHVNQVIHDLAWHEYLIDANRLLRAVEIDGAIREAHGPQVLKWMRKALEDIALGDIPSQNAFESVINHVRAGASIAAMGWNLWTSMMQPLGLTQSASRIGTKWVAKGLGRVIGDAAHMENTARWVYDRSEFMRLRALTQQREIAEIRNKVGDKSPLRKTVELAVPAGVVDAVEDSYFILMAKAQMIADLPTWIGQYEKSMEAGETEERAADLADQAVLDSQGGGQIKDLSGIQRGNALMKLWTNFYSYFNTTYNLMADRTAQLRRVGPSDLPAFAVDQLMLTALPSVLTTLLYQLVKGDDDDWDKVPSKMASDLFGYLTGLMVGLREVGAVLNPDSSYAGPAGARVFSEINKFGKQVQQGEVDESLARSGNQLAGILFHYPAGQVDRTARGLYAMEQGEAGPLAPVVGPPPKQ